MEDFVWRRGAKTGAVIDILLICMGSLLAYLGPALFKENKSGSDSNSNDINWIVVVICVLVILLQLWAAVKLLRAATAGQDPKYALGAAYNWGNVTVGFLVISIFIQIVRLNIVGLIIIVVWKGTSLYVVGQYTYEINRFLNSPRNTSNNQPENVIVGK